MDLSQVSFDSITKGFALHCGVNGHDKDWIVISTTSDKLVVFWGKSGSRYQSAERAVPKGRTAQSYMADLVSDKLGKGYEIVYSHAGKSWTEFGRVEQQPTKQDIPTKESVFKDMAAPTTAANWDF